VVGEKIYNKLVRDRIPDVIRKSGHYPVYRILSQEEYYQGLRIKLQEEVSEFLSSDEDTEIADILEVVDAILNHRGIAKQAIDDIRSKKAKSNGQFNERIFLEKVEEFEI
jgi:predicted house-cleaning noncanonical NTP pyrophosphatase (MazG superfamily)